MNEDVWHEEEDTDGVAIANHENDGAKETCSWFRFVILALASLMLFGHYFAYDSIGAVGPFLKSSSSLHFTMSDLGWMYAGCALPNMFLLLVGGLVVDRFGTTSTGLLFNGLIVLGAVLVALADSFWTMFAGRFLLGVGEIAFVVQSSIFSKWFRGRELTLSFSIGHMVGRAGTLLSLNILPNLAEKYSFRVSLWVAAATCMVSFLFSVALILSEQFISTASHVMTSTSNNSSSSSSSHQQADTVPLIPVIVKQCSGDNEETEGGEQLCSFEDGNNDDGDDDVDSIKINTKHALECNNDIISSGHGGGSGGAGFSLKSIQEFPLVFACLCGVICFFYGTILPFIAFAVTLLNKAYGYSEEDAGRITSILSLMSLFASPLFGIAIDYIGGRSNILLVGSAVSLPLFFVLALTDISPVPIIIILGISYSFVPGVLFSSVSLVVPQHAVGVAFGLAYMSEAIGLFFSPILIGYVVDTWGYRRGLVTFGLLKVIEFVFCVLIKVTNRTPALDHSPKKFALPCKFITNSPQLAVHHHARTAIQKLRYNVCGCL